MVSPDRDADTRVRRAIRRAGVPDSPRVPDGALVDLPGRGSTYVTDIPGPPGAPTLILLHGTASTATLTWFPALASLAERYRVVLFDQRWHGRGIRTRPFTVADCTDDVIAIADALELERPICAGYSLGGMVALSAAHHHPDRVAGIVLCATPYRFREKLREKAFHRAFGAMAGALGPYSLRRVARFGERLPDVPENIWDTEGFERWAMKEFRSTSGWAVAQVVAELGRFDASPWLPTLKTPTSVVITTRDHAIPVYRQLEMATMIPGATIHLAAVGHAGCVFGAERFVPALLDACESVAERI
ncbi:alpha/beta hydrolase [Nocardia puris]|uniref:alpha/beta fold hydrolase n=1 Tax=Nocardia puris TaxID=208602 RepID=UPI001895380C|nr:alpha/beta hydrolase [Nocardia puris]MBF6215042.1 alpha/beta hydrolase [Nocardia puris]MBF6367191.1 alpha/beta hydrolase [Nocardia puris]MBF6461832.1 alpha/beta hydrolase [Nocardia puris]